MRLRTTARRGLPLLLLALATAGCDLSLGGYDRDIGGFYAYAGTVRNSPGYSVNGDLYVNQRSSRRAEVALEWFMLEGSHTILEIVADDVPFSVDSDGRFRFTVTGDLRLSGGRWTRFRLEHDGRMSGRTMRGDWTLTTDATGTDRGTFTASR